MDELIAKLQAKIETALEQAFPHFDRPQLVSRLMLISHSHGLEVSQKLMDHYHMYGVQPVVISVSAANSCPECKGVGARDVCGLHGQCPDCCGTGLRREIQG